MLKNILVAVILAVLALAFLRGITGEDTWICQNGEWVRHGNPVSPKPSSGCPGVQSKKEATMKLTSSAFGDNQLIPKVYSCDGRSIHPPLTLADIPAGVRTFAIITDDPDAPMGTFTHWVIWNIPLETRELPEGVLPAGAIEGINSAGRAGYTGPCPPSGTHHYMFTVYALDTALTLPPQTKKTELQAAMNGHIMAQTQLTGLYSR